MNRISSYEGLKQAEAYQKIEARKQRELPSMTPVQRLGAFAMSKLGKVTSNIESRPSTLEINAYNPRYTVARRIYATALGVALAVPVLAGGMVGYMADKVDNDLACSGEGGSAVLASGERIASIAEQVPHEHTPISDVVEGLVDLNPTNFGYSTTTDQYNTDQYVSGVYKLPSECDSVIQMPSLDPRN